MKARELLKARVIDALANTAPALALSDLVRAVGGTNDTSVKAALRELIAEGRVTAGRETRKALKSWVAPAGRPYVVPVYSLADPVTARKAVE